MRKITFLMVLLYTSLSFAQTFTENFDGNTGVVTSFNKMLQGVSFTFAFTSDGNGGDFAWENQYGDGNSASINLQSQAFDTGAIEKITITRTDGQNFRFTSIFINNTAGTTVTVAGYDENSLIGSSQTVLTGTSNTLSFSDIIIDEVRITATDFLNTNIDTFKGDIDATLGLENHDLVNNKLSVSPNPASNYIQVSGLKNVENYKLYNVLGAKILEGSLSVNKQIQLEGLNKGVYFLQVNDNKTIKFIKQ